jgi:acetate kinase
MKPTTASVLTVNGGSSSIKFALFEADGSPRRILDGRIEGIGLGQGSFEQSRVGTSYIQMLSRVGDVAHSVARGSFPGINCG